MGAGWWAYEAITVIPPPDATKATVEDVKTYIGSERGLLQLPVAQREQWLVNTWQNYATNATPQQRAELTQALSTMTIAQERVFGRAVAGVMKHHVMEGAREYHNCKTAAQKAAYVKQFYGKFRDVQSRVTGGGPVATPGGSAPNGVAPTGVDFAKPLTDVSPKTGEQFQNIIVNETTPHERTKAEPFVQKLVEEHKQELQKAASRR
jgi:hypothetical protein